MIVGGYKFGLASNDLIYMSPVTLNDAGPNDSDNYWVAPRSGSAKNLYLKVNVLIGAGEFIQLTFVKNNILTTLQVQMNTGDPTTKSDTTHEISFVAGDTLSMQIHLSSGAIAPRAFFGMEIVLP